MRLHTKLTAIEVYDALIRAKDNAKVTRDVTFVVFSTGASRTHAYGHEVQLGTYDKHSLPPGTMDQHGRKMNVRRYKNSGSHGCDSVWAATYDEWGWFIIEVFEADPTARFGPKPKPGSPGWGIYAGPDDFHQKTHGHFSRDGL